MTDGATAAPRTGSGAAGLRWVALVAVNAALGFVGAVAVALWPAVLDGLAGRAGWVREDPTMFRDGFTPWLLLAGAATAVDLVLVLPLNAVLRRWRGAPAGPSRAVAAGAHLAVAIGLAVAWVHSLPVLGG